MSTTPDPGPRWEQRYRATRVSLPDHALLAPHRRLYVSNATGTSELYAWDTGTDVHRQVTDRANGTSDGALSPDGESVWWFADTDGDESGIWLRQPFGGGPDVEAVPGLQPGFSGGLALGVRVVAVGRSTHDGSSIHVAVAGAPPVTVYAHAEDAHVGDLSRDETLLAIGHSEHGDAMKPAVRVLRLLPGGGTETVAELWDGPNKGLDVLGFSPLAGDARLLLGHEREGRRLPLVWDPVTGAETRVDPVLPGVDAEAAADTEWGAEWFPDATALLLHAETRGRGSLHRYDLATGELTALTSGPGSVSDSTVLPDGSVQYTWSSAAEPARMLALDGTVLLTPPGPRAPGSVDVSDVDVEGPGGRVHSLLAVPPHAPTGPWATVFVVHGGPMAHDRDSFAADRAMWVDHGYAVVQVNYRGSTGYGADWQDAITGRPGLVELEDVEAVRVHLVATGVADPARCVLTGGSWGGFLTLLGLGTQPEAWAAGVAAVPVADYVAAYADEMEGLKAIDRVLFGGSPTDVPELYARSSPITYVDAVRAPVLVLAGANDPRCPIRQIDNYLAALADAGKEHEVYRFDAGHGSLVVDERVKQAQAELEFVQRHVPT